MIIDVCKPVGAWLREHNSAVRMVDEKPIVFVNAIFGWCSFLMKSWFKLFQEVTSDVSHGIEIGL